METPEFRGAPNTDVEICLPILASEIDFGISEEEMAEVSRVAKERDFFKKEAQALYSEYVRDIWKLKRAHYDFGGGIPDHLRQKRELAFQLGEVCSKREQDLMLLRQLSEQRPVKKEVPDAGIRAFQFFNRADTPYRV